MAKRAKVKTKTYKKSVKKSVKKSAKKPGKQLKPFGHDEPIVVDNGPVSISNRDAVVTLKGGGKKAERKFTKFLYLIVEKTKNGMTLPTETFDLAEDGGVTFHLFDPGTGKSDTIEVTRFGFPKNSVRLESSVDLFKFEDGQKKYLKMTGNAMARLTVIYAVGTSTIHKVTLADDHNNFLFDFVRATVEPVPH